MPKADFVYALVQEVARLDNRLLAAADAMMADLGLTAARWQVLNAVARAGSTTVSQAARGLGLTRQAVQRVANELAREGFLAAAPNPRDRRAPLLSLTDKGRGAHEAAAARQRPWAEGLAAGLSEKKLTRTIQRLRQIRERLENGAPD